jgi:hypothetical protein
MLVSDRRKTCQSTPNDRHETPEACGRPRQRSATAVFFTPNCACRRSSPGPALTFGEDAPTFSPTHKRPVELQGVDDPPRSRRAPCTFRGWIVHKKHVHILHLEDSKNDAELVNRR